MCLMAPFLISSLILINYIDTNTATGVSIKCIFPQFSLLIIANSTLHYNWKPLFLTFNRLWNISDISDFKTIFT